MALFTGFVIKAIGERSTILVGSTIFCIGTATTYWTLDSEVQNNDSKDRFISYAYAYDLVEPKD